MALLCGTLARRRLLRVVAHCWPSLLFMRQARFDNDAFIEEHLSKTINQVVVLYTPTADVVRPKPDHEYGSLHGIKKTFLFMAVREGVILQRSFACWCWACMHASAPGQGTMDTDYCCSGCVSSLAWQETAVERTDARGIANERQRTRNKARISSLVSVLRCCIICMMII